MKLTTLIIFFLVLAQQDQAQNNDAKNVLKFKQEIQELGNILQLPGYTLAVVKNGKVVYRQTEGYSNLEKNTLVHDDDLFMIASVTKTFTANLMMQYEQEHKASVEDYVLKYRYIDLNNGWPYNIDANTRVRHFMSHTSEDGPGSSFVYNGSRFNFIYGVFEAVGKYQPGTDAYTAELQKRILTPLGMTHTISGFPKSRTDTMFRHITTPYIFDKASGRLVEDTINYARWTHALPSGGLLSTIDDLVKYTNSYDDKKLITKESYEKVTTPTTLTDSSLSPYGIGWFTEEFAGKKIHWHYGQADSYAALFIRVPETGYTFIFLANSNAPSDALRLGSGRIWQSPFAAKFLQYFIFAKDVAAQKKLVIEEQIGRALFLHYIEKMAGAHKSEAQGIIKELAKTHPKRFEQYDPALIYLLTDINDSGFQSMTDKLADAYRKQRHIQPYVATDLAQYYMKNGRKEEALEFYRKLADAKGFESWQLATEASRKTGHLLMEAGNIAEGRAYYWKAINDMKLQWADDTAINGIIEEMNKNKK